MLEIARPDVGLIDVDGMGGASSKKSKVATLR